MFASARLTHLVVAFAAWGTAVAAPQRRTFAEDATEFALAYGYPWLPWNTLASATFLPGSAVNNITCARVLVNPNATRTVSPNSDTLYCKTIWDLSQTDLVLTQPTIPDRFWAASFFTPYGDNPANVDVFEGSPPGKYLVQRKVDNPSTNVGLALSNGTSDYQGVVTVGTTYGLILHRYLVHPDCSDCPLVWGYQNLTTVVPVARSGPKGDDAPALTQAMITPNASLSTAEQILDLTARLSAWNPPHSHKEEQRVNQTLKQAGVDLATQSFTPPAGVDLNATWDSTFLAMAEAKVEANDPFANGWSQTAPLGHYGANYLNRADTAYWGYMALPEHVAIYAYHSEENSTFVTIGPNEARLLTFHGVPPLREFGFWSVTMYGSNLLLVPNSLNRYAIGDRTNLTYPSGLPVYPTNASSTDKPFQILIQPGDVKPPANWTNNWLPAPAGGGNFTYSLRLYGATKAIFDKKYELPTVENITALKGS